MAISDVYVGLQYHRVFKLYWNYTSRGAPCLSAEVYRGTMYDGTEVAIKVGGLGELATNYPVVKRLESSWSYRYSYSLWKMGSQLELRVEFPIVSRFHMTKLNMAIPKASQIAIVKHGNVLAMCWQSFQMASSLHDRNDMTGASRARGSGLRRRSSGRGWSICPFSGE